MGRAKQKVLHSCGVVLVAVSYLIGIFAVLFGGMVLLWDGVTFGGSTPDKAYPGGPADPGFILSALPVVVTGITLYFAGTYLRDNNQDIEA